MTQTLTALMAMAAIAVMLTLTGANVAHAHTADQRFETLEMLMGHSIERPQPVLSVLVEENQTAKPKLVPVNWIKPVQ